MTEALLTNLSFEDPSTILSMDSGIAHDDSDSPRQALICRPPDINLPLAVEINPAFWFSDTSDILDVGLASQAHDLENLAACRGGRRSGRRRDIIWGAWFFFNHYFRPSLTEKRKGKFSREGAGNTAPVEKTDLKLDYFLVQHDMENIYMWVFKERPENALGKMQLRSFMNGHGKYGEPQFPYGVENGFARSHRMQRKQYKGLSNPQCIHGIDVVRCPDLSIVSDDDKNRWMELTGRELNFSISMDAEAFTAWRSFPSNDYGERSGYKEFHGCTKKHSNKKSLVKLNGEILNLSGNFPYSDGTNVLADKKRRTSQSPLSSEECCVAHSHGNYDIESPTIESPCWLSDFTGVMTEACGPVTAAKTIYEDEQGYLIMVSLPFTDIHRVRVSWLNTDTHGVIRIHSISTARTHYIKRGDRTFVLVDPSPEHCPPGEFVREIALDTRIPENAELKAFYVEAGAGLEIMVPKYNVCSEEREVHVFLPPQLGNGESLIS